MFLKLAILIQITIFYNTIKASSAKVNQKQLLYDSNTDKLLNHDLLTPTLKDSMGLSNIDSHRSSIRDYGVNEKIKLKVREKAYYYYKISMLALLTILDII